MYKPLSPSMLSEELGLGHRACGQTDPFPCFPLKYPRLQMLLREGTKLTRSQGQLQKQIYMTKWGPLF